MAIGTPVSLGTTADAGATDPYTLSTTATTPSGALIVLGTLTGQTGASPTYSVNGGGLTWTEDKQQTGTSGSVGWTYSLWSAPAPSGLASSTTINLDIGTGSGSTFSGLMSAFYITGVSLLSDRANMVDSAFTSAGGISSWDSTASSTTVADTILIGLGFSDNTGVNSSTPTGSASEIHDFRSTDDINLTTTYRIVSATGSYSATGNWAANTAGGSGAIVVAYAIDSGAGVGPQARTFNPIPFI